MTRFDEEHDYVIVGSGSSGSVIARRLVDAGVGTVALFEEGGDDEGVEAIADPRLWRTLWGSPHDWAYQTTPQAALGGRQVTWPRGRVFGGSSSLNVMIYIRGHRADYDAWEYAGCPGWGWRDVLPLFKRSEDYADGPSQFHGAGGPLRVSRLTGRNPLGEAFIAGGLEVGLPRNHDFNGETMDGVGFPDVTIHDGRRASTSTTFLRPIMGAEHLTVVLNAMADTLIFEGDHCVGVSFVRHGERIRVRARREVILSAGVIGSPSVLLRSGIGPLDHLAELGVAPRVSSPGVGQNLHDHAIVPVVFAARSPLERPESQLMDAQFFASTDPRRVVPDLQPVLMHFPKPIEEYPAVEHGFTIGAGIVRPVSRGSLRLRSTDPYDRPLLDPAYLADSHDLEAIADAVEISRAVGNSAAMAEFRAAEVAPGPIAATREQIREFARQQCGTYHHQVGTCRMGSDDGAVLDPALRVRGVSGLRVADASIMPAVPSANTHAPSMMVGEKAADLILADAGASVESSADAAAPVGVAGAAR